MRRQGFHQSNCKLKTQRQATWPLVARAQQAESMRRIGIWSPHAADDPQGQTRLAAFLQQLQLLGWSVGRNVLVDTRWGAGDPDRYRKYAAELVALTPDVIVANTSPIVVAVQQATSTIPIVFVGLLIPWVVVSCPAWHGPAAIRLVLPFSSMASVGNGSLCSKRSHPV